MQVLTVNRRTAILTKDYPRLRLEEITDHNSGGRIIGLMSLDCNSAAPGSFYHVHVSTSYMTPKLRFFLKTRTRNKHAYNMWRQYYTNLDPELTFFNFTYHINLMLKQSCLYNGVSFWNLPIGVEKFVTSKFNTK